jgi:hypothetical protein
MTEASRGSFTEQGIAPASGSKAKLNPIAIGVLIGIAVILLLLFVVTNHARRGGVLPDRPSDTRLLNAAGSRHLVGTPSSTLQ